jgi:prefoldin subunit 5
MEGVQMSDYTIPTSNTVTTIDPQATKIRELQSDVNELKELVEYLQDRIKTLKKAGDDLAKTQTHDLLETINWFKAKDAKP